MHLNSLYKAGSLESHLLEFYATENQLLSTSVMMKIHVIGIRTLFASMFMSLAGVFTSIELKPKIISGTVSQDMCPTDEEREATRQEIISTVNALIQGAEILPEGHPCGSGIWKRIAHLT